MGFDGIAQPESGNPLDAFLRLELYWHDPESNLKCIPKPERKGPQAVNPNPS